MPIEPTPAIVVLTTAGSDDEAERIAQALVERGFAACVNVVRGVSSTYRWEGKLVTDEESLLIIKTVEARQEDVEHTIAEVHSYEVPEILALPVTGGSRAYLDWLSESADGSRHQ